MDIDGRALYETVLALFIHKKSDCVRKVSILSLDSFIICKSSSSHFSTKIRTNLVSTLILSLVIRFADFATAALAAFPTGFCIDSCRAISAVLSVYDANRVRGGGRLAFRSMIEVGKGRRVSYCA